MTVGGQVRERVGGALGEVSDIPGEDRTSSAKRTTLLEVQQIGQDSAMLASAGVDVSALRGR